jgi:hypothetical protein
MAFKKEMKNLLKTPLTFNGHLPIIVRVDKTTALENKVIPQ